MTPNLPAPPLLVGLIQQGFTAERTFTKVYSGEAQQLAQTTYHIPESQVKSVVTRALNAAIKTIRFDKWQPDLITRVVQSQALIFRWQQGRMDTKDFQEKIKEPIERFVRSRLEPCLSETLSIDQEDVCGDTVEVFIKKLQDPKFRLTSALDTFLIGIAIRRINSFRSRFVAQTSFTTVSRPDDQETVVALEKIRFYRKAHRLIANQLSQLDDKCLTIILQHYGIDPVRLETAEVIPEPDGPLTEAQFTALFNVALGPNGQSRKLKEIATDLKISPNKISDHHLDCVDKLVGKVLPILLGNSERTPATSFNRLVRQQMKDRLNEKQIRDQKKRLEKQRERQRHAQSRQA